MFHLPASLAAQPDPVPRVLPGRAATSPIRTRGGRGCSVPCSMLSHVGTHSTRNQQLVQHLFGLPNAPGNHCPKADYMLYAPLNAPRSFFPLLSDVRTRC